MLNALDCTVWYIYLKPHFTNKFLPIDKIMKKMKLKKKKKGREFKKNKVMVPEQR